tara:strand:+ start:180 stop:380 length:201 start_codon:yes stop_codon:yes gene_type:complete
VPERFGSTAFARVLARIRRGPRERRRGFSEALVRAASGPDELEAFLVSRARCRIITRGRRALRLGN